MRDSEFWHIERAYNDYRRNAVNTYMKPYGSSTDKETIIRLIEWRMTGEFDTLYRHATALRRRLQEFSPDDELLGYNKPETNIAPVMEMYEAARKFANADISGGTD